MQSTHMSSTTGLFRKQTPTTIIIQVKSLSRNEDATKRLATILNEVLLCNNDEPIKLNEQVFSQLSERVEADRDLCAFHLKSSLKNTRRKFEKILTVTLAKVENSSESTDKTKQGKKKSYFWRDEEHISFIALFHTHGRSWKRISESQPERDSLQCRTHG